MFGWQARPCTNLHGMYRWFGVVPQGGFLALLCVDFRSSLLAVFWEWFLGVFGGCHVWGFVPLWMMNFPANLSWIGLDLVVFRVGRVLDLERRFLWFLLIVSISGWFLWGRGCPGGNPANPEVSLQSVEWFGRSGARKLGIDPRAVFLGEAV
jgi:hypothetical protein